MKLKTIEEELNSNQGKSNAFRHVRNKGGVRVEQNLLFQQSRLYTSGEVLLYSESDSYELYDASIVRQLRD